MPRSLPRAPQLTTAALHTRDRQSDDAVARRPDQVRWVLRDGHRCPAVARLIGSSAAWLRTVVRRYNQDGAAALGAGRQANLGPRPFRAAAGLVALRDRLATPPPRAGWGPPRRWRSG